MARRKSFDSLIEEEARQVSQPSAPPPPLASRGEEEVAKFATSELPKYLQFVTKTVRLRPDQYEELTRLARELNRRKRGGERITENTLARIAFDLLLSQKERLQGASETELMTSVTRQK